MASPPQEPTPGYGPQAAPLEPVRTAHRRDFLYLRASFGAGYLHANEVTDGIPTDSPPTPALPDATITGTGVALSVMLGGTLAPGAVIGGAVFYSASSSPTIEATGHQHCYDFLGLSCSLRKGPFSLLLIGAFMDLYPKPDGGFHAGGIIGPALTGTPDFVDTSGEFVRRGQDLRGFGASAFAGYDFRLSNRWAIGALLQGTVAAMEAGGGEPAAFTTTNVTVLFSVVYR